MANAVYTEVLEVQVDLKAFKTGLTALEREWNGFIQRIGKDNAGGVFQIAGVGNLQRDIAGLREEVGQFAEHFGAAFEDVGKRVDGAMKKAEVAMGDRVERGANRAKQAVGGVAGEMGRVRSETEKTGSAWERFSTKLTHNLPELAATVIKYAAGFMLFRAALSAVLSVLAFIPNQIARGLEALNRYEEVESELQEVIADNAVFSEDIAKNWERAGEAAKSVREELQIVAARTHFSTDAVQSVFQSIFTSGGDKFVKDMGEAVRLTELFSAALKATGEKTTNIRKLMTEVSNLLTGQVTSKTKILRLMGLNTQQWEAIRSAARDNRDLVARIEPYLQATIEKLEGARGRMKEMGDLWEVLSERIAATAAAPLWERLRELMSAALEVLEQYQPRIEGIAATVGVLILRVFELVEAIAMAVGGVETLGNLFGRLLQGFTLMVELVSTWLNHLSTGLMILGKGVNFILEGLRDPFNSDNWKKEFDDFATFALQKSKELDSNNAETVRRILQVDENRDKGAGKSFAFGVSDKVTPGRDDKAAMTAANQRLAASIAEVREQESGYREELKTAQEERTLSVEESVSRRVASHQRELEQITALIEAEKARTAGFKQQGFTDAQLQARIDSLNKQLLGVQRQNDRDTNRTQRELIKNNLEQQRESLRHELALTEQIADAKLAAIRQQVDAGLVLQSEAAQQQQTIEDELHIQRIGNLQEQLELAGQNESEMLRVQNQITEAEAEHAAQRKLSALEIIELQRREREEQLRHVQRMRELGFESREIGRSEQALQGGSPRELANISVQSAQDRKRTADLIVKDIEGLIADVRERLKAAGQSDEQITQNAALNDLLEEKAEAENAATKAAVDLSEAAKEASSALPTFTHALNSAKNIFTSVLSDFKSGGLAEGLGGLFSKLGSFLQQDTKKISQDLSNLFGSKMGGALGGFIGKFSETLGSVLGPAGALLNIGSMVFGLFRGLFTAAARRIGNEIRKGIKEITQQYQAGEKSLVDTITALEAKRAEAIQRLSGKKGGKDELKKILPEIDKQLIDLRNQQKEILEQFHEQLSVMRLQSEPLGNALRMWQEINKQVKEYLGAGGDAVKANEFLSLSLQKLREDTLRDLRDGEAEAIQDAIALNDLLSERIKLVEDFKRAEFDAINKGALERRAAPAVEQGMELERRRKEHEEKLAQIDSEISRMTLRVEREREVFNLASDTAALRSRANELELIALDEQIKKWREMQQIVAGIFQRPDGSFGLAQGFGVSIGAIQVVVNGNGGQVNGTQIAGEILAEIERRGRFGLDTAVFA